MFPALIGCARCAWNAGQSLVLVSGTGELSPEFSQTVNVPGDVMETAANYLALGGVNNFAELFRFLSDRLMLTGYGYAPPSAMPEHGIYLPDMDAAEIGDWERQADPLKPTAAILFYRAHRMSGNTAFIDTLAQAFAGARDERALHLYFQSQSEGGGQAGGIPMDRRPRRCVDIDVVLCPGRCGYRQGDAERSGGDSLERLGIPVIQAIASGMPRGAWEGSRRGLNALDTAVNVAIPEFDGRIISVPVSFKERGATGS